MSSEQQRSSPTCKLYHESGVCLAEIPRYPPMASQALLDPVSKVSYNKRSSIEANLFQKAWLEARWATLIPLQELLNTVSGYPSIGLWLTVESQLLYTSWKMWPCATNIVNRPYHSNQDRPKHAKSLCPATLTASLHCDHPSFQVLQEHIKSFQTSFAIQWNKWPFLSTKKNKVWGTIEGSAPNRRSCSNYHHSLGEQGSTLARATLSSEAGVCSHCSHREPCYQVQREQDWALNPHFLLAEWTAVYASDS